MFAVTITVVFDMPTVEAARRAGESYIRHILATGAYVDLSAPDEIKVTSVTELNDEPESTR